jgi:hypothetical protein
VSALKDASEGVPSFFRARAAGEKEGRTSRDLARARRRDDAIRRNPSAKRNAPDGMSIKMSATWFDARAVPSAFMSILPTVVFTSVSAMSGPASVAVVTSCDLSVDRSRCSASLLLDDEATRTAHPPVDGMFARVSVSCDGRACAGAAVSGSSSAARA